MHQRYFAAYADEIPYLVAYVKLAEGPFMITTLADSPEDLRIDLLAGGDVPTRRPCE